MNVLITGGCGYIGSHVALCLLQRGDGVVIADNLCNSSEEVLHRIGCITGKTPVFYRMDICDHTALDRLFSENAIDTVIHCAGLKAVGESVQKPIEYYQNNLNATLTLLDAMHTAGVKRILFSSSATVYGDDNPMPLREDATVGGCTNPYGWSKFFSEIILRDAAKADSDLSVMLLRYFNPIGAHESGFIGENPNGIPNNLIPYIAQVAVGKLERLHIFGDDYPTPDGTGIRDYIHVMDLAEGHIAAADYLLGKTGVSVFNLGTGHGYSVLEVLHSFEIACGHEIPYIMAPRRAGDLPVCYADPSKAERELGWKARRDLAEMCRDSWNWQKNNPDGY